MLAAAGRFSGSLRYNRAIFNTRGKQPMRRASLRPLPFVLAATDTGTMIVNRNDHCTNAAGLTYGVGHQFLNTASFDADEVDALLRLLHLRRQYFGDGVTALDCGANIGAHSIAWGIEMTHWGKVVAFEAQERIFYALAGNIAINNCFNVKAVHAALGCPAGGGGRFCRYPSPTTTAPLLSAVWSCAVRNATSLSAKPSITGAPSRCR